jgi:hypothetical protein
LHVHFNECKHDPNAPLGTEGTIRVCPAGVFPKRPGPGRDADDKELWPDGYVPSPNLPSPGGFKDVWHSPWAALKLSLRLSAMQE